MRHLAIAFKISCVIAATFMTAFWIYKFHKNEDSTLVEYRLVKNLKDVILPELSLCLRDPFLNESLADFGLTKDDYYNYLVGNSSPNNITLGIEYDNVTLNIFDYHPQVDMSFKSQKNGSYASCSNIKNCRYFNFKINFNGIMKKAFLKCFGIEINKEFTNDVDFYLLTFDNKLRSVIGEAQMSILSFNQPNQFVRNFRGNKPFRWSSNHKGKTDMLEVTSIEMLKRRDKKQEHCMAEWKIYDQILEQNQIKKVGCRAPYQRSPIEIPVCSSMEEMERVLFDGEELAMEYGPPCQEMPTIEYNHGVLEADPIFGDNISIYVSYPNEWKIITQSQLVDVHALIGYIGGYIGLFLGNIYSTKYFEKKYVICNY